MRRAVVAVAVLTASSLSFAADGGHAAADAPKSAMVADGGVAEPTVDFPKDLKKDDDKVFYLLGLSVGKAWNQFSPSKAEVELIKRGMTEGLNHPDKVNPAALQPWGQKVQKLVSTRSEAKSKVFLDKAEKEKGVQKIDDGILYTSIKEGTGASPKATDKVKVNYRGTLPDGSEFDSSYKRGQPIEFPLNGVIPCWTKGVQKMKVGGKGKLVCPPKTAYGERGQPNIPANSPLQFEIELLEVSAAPPAPAPGSNPGIVPPPATKK